MYFKRLELVGFKSFMNKTTLNFEPGVTAVVGPNGCGKSNIFDAIRWVLGEQSVKSLRGSDMQDVIFNGTDSQAAVSMAEVSLAFANEQRFFSVDNDEVVITRRLFRSGESEYLLNKTQVRLKDIMDLLMGTGIGAESYSIVAQGKIDLILSSKPEERRMVFDEASGITKYKSQKKEALRKLEETEQNLLRINDIISEVQRSIGHLERQANKARRYKELFEELKTKDITLSLFQKNDLVKKKQDIENQINALKVEEETLLNKIKEEEAGIELQRQELKVWEDNISAIKNEVFSLENLTLRNKQHVAFNEERISELRERVGYLNNQIEQVKGRIALDEEKIIKFKEEHSGIQMSIQQKFLLLKETEIQLNYLVCAIKVSLDNMAQAKRSMLECVAAIAQAKNEAADLTSKHHVQFARQKRLELEKNKTDEERKAIETSLNNLSLEISQIEEAGRALGLEMANIQSETECQSNLLNQINSELDKLEKQRLTLESQKEFLEKLKTEYEGIDTSMNALIYLDKAPSEKISGLVVKIKEYLNIGELDKVDFPATGLKLSAEAKPVDLDTDRVAEKIARIKEEIEVLKVDKSTKEAKIEGLRRNIQEYQEKQKSQEIALGNKKTVYQGIFEQFNKVKEEEELIALELSDINEDISRLDEKLNLANNHFT
jgi:chromosome segregation protein